MHNTESELIRVTSYKARKKFDNRQDYLGSITNAMLKLDPLEYGKMTPTTCDWCDAAIAALNNKEDIPDFDEVTASVDADSEDEATDKIPPEEEAADSPEAEDDAPGDDEDDPVEDYEETAEDDASADVVDDDAPDEEAEPVKKPAKKAAKKVAKTKAEKLPSKGPSVPLKRQGPHDKRVDRDEDVVLDKFGCMEGSKNSNALKMFEKGATAKEIKTALGGTYYNILKKQQKLGHLIEKEGAIIKLTHKDFAGGKKTVVKKPKR